MSFCVDMSDFQHPSTQQQLPVRVPNESNTATRNIAREFGGEQYNQGIASILGPDISAQFLADSVAGSQLEEIPVTIEEPWTEEAEAHLRNWMAEAKESQAGHRKTGFKLKHRYRVLAITILVWSSIILIVNQLLDCSDDEVYQLIQTFFQAVMLLLNAVFSLLNYGYTYREHFEYEAKFFELAEDIEVMLLHGRDFRMPSDSFIMEIRERRKKLALAPEYKLSKKEKDKRA